MSLETLKCKALGREMTVSRYMAGESENRPWAVLFHEIWGLTPFIRASVAALGSAGYNVFAASFTEAYGGEVDYPYADMESARKLRARYVDDEINQMVDEIASGLAARVELAVGFCWGGYAACNYALHRKQVRVISFYGPDIDRLSALEFEGQLHFAQKDHLIGPEKRSAVEKMRGPGLKIFDDYDANHGFMCWERPAYDEAAMRRGLARASAYVGETLASRA
jgi:carboxymethylenebutenolidase